MNEDARAEAGRAEPEVSGVAAFALAVAQMVGIGVFTSLGFQIQQISSPFSLLMMWVVGGIIALCGALSYAELAAALPGSGGECNYLSRIYHPALGFVAGWVSITVGFAAPTALAAMAFGSYAVGVVDIASPIVWAFGVTLLAALMHLGGARAGSAFQCIATFLKILLILAFIMAAFFSGKPSTIATFAPSWNDITHLTGATFANGVVFVMYSYWGWNASTYVAGDVRDPQRNLPLSIVGATLFVLALYTGLNAAFLYSTPMSSLAGQVDVASIAGKAIFGDAGGRFVAFLICFGLIPSISSLMWIGPRVAAVMGEQVRVLAPLASRNSNGVPAVATLYQTGVVILLLLTGSFSAVLDFIQFGLTLISCLTVLGVIVLRVTQPRLRRPFQMRGYPIIPIVFVATTGVMLINLVTERPLQSLGSFAVMVAGLAIYAASSRCDTRLGN